MIFFKTIIKFQVQNLKSSLKQKHYLTIKKIHGMLISFTALKNNKNLQRVIQYILCTYNLKVPNNG